MLEKPEHGYFLKEQFPTAGPELLRLMQSAVDNAYLLRSDFYTVRDWLETADYRDKEDAHAILLLMLIALEEGSLCIEISEQALAQRLREIAPGESASTWARRLTQSAAEYPRLIGTLPEANTPILCRQVANHRFLYFHKYLRAEIAFHQALTQRLQTFETPAVEQIAPIVRVVLDSQLMRLDNEQCLALGSALLNNMTFISGGPGTGKTSIVFALLRCLFRTGIGPDRIALAAPTGRAAQRLTDAIRAGIQRLPPGTDEPIGKLSANTLHTLLGYQPYRNRFSRHAENPVDADVVIVDEVSMVGLVLMSQLLQALSPKTRLILLGDKDQLPSVDAGAILATLIPAEQDNGLSIDHAQRLRSLFPDLALTVCESTNPLHDRAVLLKTNHRSQAQIREAARSINEQDSTLVDRLPELRVSDMESLEGQSGCRLLEQVHGTPGELRGFLQRWTEQAYFQSKLDGRTFAECIGAVELDEHAQQASPDRFKPLFQLMDRFRLLTLVRESAFGCDDINRYLETLLRPRLDSYARGGLFTGAPVLITRNDPTRGLFNGDVGIALRDRAQRLRVLFQRQDGCVAFPAESLPAHELGFALTVHKSQGSEYENVMVVLPPSGGRRLLTKELIYTAITRAKSLAVICASKEVLRFAISRRIVRESGMWPASVEA